MGIETISAYAVGIIVLLVIVGFMLKSAKKFSIVIINTLFGGALFVVLNILGMNLALNIINILLVVFLGVPGVFIVIVLKLMMGE